MPAVINQRTITAGAIGTVLEWYDFGVYAFLATVLAKHFFPAGDSAMSLIATFGVFASGYLMRPVGAVVLGHIGDRVGRRPALIIAVTLMAAATTAIAAASIAASPNGACQSSSSFASTGPRCCGSWG